MHRQKCLRHLPSIRRVRPARGAVREAFHEKRFRLSEFFPLSRREFFTRSLGGAAVAVSGTIALAQNGGPGALPTLKRWSETGRFTLPRRLARRVSCGPDGNLYVVCDNSLCSYDKTGALLKDLAFDSAPHCVTAADGETIYIGFKERVEALTGAKRVAWEAPPGKPWLTGLAAGKNEVYAADSGNRIVWRYDRSGKLLGRIGQKDKERNVPGLIVPSPYLTVAMAPDGLLRVNNPGRHRVELYSPEGDLESFWGAAGGGKVGFCGCCNPTSVAVLPDGRQITCEKGFARVKVFSASGEFEGFVAAEELFAENNRAGRTAGRADGLLGGLDAAGCPDGRVVVLDLVMSEVRIFKQS